MRAIQDEWKKGDFKFVLGYDTGGDVGGETQLDIYWKQDNNYIHFYSRTFYFNDANEIHIRNFAKKVESDSIYRKEIQSGTLDWQKVEEVYSEASREIYYRYRAIPNFGGYNASDNNAKDEHRQTYTLFERQCERLYNNIKKNILEISASWQVDKDRTINFLINQLDSIKI